MRQREEGREVMAPEGTCLVISVSGCGYRHGAWRELQKSGHEGLRHPSLDICISLCWGWETVKGFNQECPG